MVSLKSNDPAPSRLSYKINRLFYRLWFKLLLIIVFLALSVLLTKKFLHKNIDLNAEIRSLSKESSDLYKGLTELSVRKYCNQRVFSFESSGLKGKDRGNKKG